MLVQKQDDGKHGKFFILEKEEEVASMTFTWAGSDKIIIDHTEVQPSQKGKGLGLELLKAVVEEARTKALKVLPLCPFANAMMKKHTEFQDVLI
ncbi:MAG: GNAT family N-acetyltransferase [Bacteroidota bacterium]